MDTKDIPGCGTTRATFRSKTLRLRRIRTAQSIPPYGTKSRYFGRRWAEQTTETAWLV